ncbi:MAG TPA: tetratricopeptide repeat protein [Thermoanaerobaculia bacterium]|nr:tetratricopeptide repeat protein [Thermoanaerobaculia bacterium]
MSNGAFPDRVSQLRARWEADPTSRVFLQLAEEYRHQGRVKEALEVLERGLKEHPGYLSALVAKGRCYLELGEPQLARGVLERVVKQDATQMVANKLLVRAYLETGEPERARERLDLYSLLNDSDPEIDELRRRIKAAERAPDPDDTQPGMAAAPAAALEPAAAGDVFDLGLPAPARRPVEDIFQFAEAPSAAPAAAGAEELKPLAVVPTAEDPFVEPEVVESPPMEMEMEEDAADGDLFPGLASQTTRERYLSALSAEGIFALDLPAEVSVAVTAPAPPEIEEPPPAPEFAPEPELPEPEPFPMPMEPAPPAPEPFAEPLPVELPPVELFAPEPEPEPEPEPAATVTLGDLYLGQGHLREAAGIFREVLEREPDNAAAHHGLQRVGTAAREPRPLDARELLAGVDSGGSKARKTFFLNRYLERIRQGSQRDVS